MALAYPKLQLPDAAETIAFRAVERILRTDPTLKRVVRHWVAWDGDPCDIFEPTFSTCPYLKLSPAPQPSAWEAEGMHRMPMVISLLAAVAGSNADQLMNYWAAIRRALWPAVDAERFAWVRLVHQDAHIIKPTLQLAAYGVKVEEQGVRLLVAEGRLTLVLHINTP